MATSTEKEGKPKSGKSRIVLFSLLALGLAAGAGGSYFYLGSKGHGEEPAARVEEPIFMALDPFTVNLQPGGRSRFLHVSMTLKMTDPKLQARIAQYLPEVRSRVLTVLSNREGESLASAEDRSRLGADILAAVNQPFAAGLPPQKIASVMFTTFMLQ